MSKLETNPLTGQQVLVAPERASRPGALLSESNAARCPFCPGHESDTPPEVDRAGSSEEWSIRVVPNRYPAIRIEPPSPRGRHEVIVEGRSHERFDKLRIDTAVAAVTMYRERFRALAGESGIRQVVLFKNEGRNAGASIPHPHSQIISLDFIPPRSQLEMETFQKAAAEGRCPLCDLVNSEQSPRAADDDSLFRLMAPSPSRSPYQLWLLPKRHAPSLTTLGSSEVSSLAASLQQAIGQLTQLLGEIAFNWSFQTAPIAEPESERTFHWYCEITPRVTHDAGFELSTGITINPITPERAAAELSGESAKSKVRRTKKAGVKDQARS